MSRPRPIRLPLTDTAWVILTALAVLLAILVSALDGCGASRLSVGPPTTTNTRGSS